MNKYIKNFFISLISIKRWRRLLCEEKKSEHKNIIVDAYYGNIYTPPYPGIKISNSFPEIYNKSGGKMEFFFLRDRITSHLPYVCESKYFIWDRYNVGLDTHFYGHKSILEKMGQPVKAYGLFTETESIIPNEYAIFKTHKGIENDFTGILTYSEELLDNLNNAIFFNGLAQVWYGQEICNGKKDPVSLSNNNYKNKTNNISMICSDKLMTKMHYIRHAIAQEALISNKVDVYGKFSNKPIAFKSEALKNYRFHIVVENDIKPYNWTEKIMDCFASMTIPIYVGASKIGQFFNEDGIINASNLVECPENLSKIIKNCTVEEYESRLNAVKDNYQRSLQYLNPDDALYELLFKGNKK
ncbi:MAG: glycosyltransferase family 10 [Alphaproteobacteria bacterium]|nr:glycosyltransferase family 10 [Alphaproteobacteria bacterium]